MKKMPSEAQLEEARVKFSPAPAVCAHCQKVGASSCCGKCRQAWYCGRECQTSAWKQHKPECKLDSFEKMKWPKEVEFPAASLSFRQALARSTESSIVTAGLLQSPSGLHEHIGALLAQSRKDMFEEHQKPHHLIMACALVEGVKPLAWMLKRSKRRVSKDAQEPLYAVVECNEPIERLMGRATSSVRIAVMSLDETSLRRYIRLRYAENHGAKDAENARQCEQDLCKRLDAVVSNLSEAMLVFYKHSQPPFQFGGSIVIAERYDVRTETAFTNLLQLCLDHASPEALCDAQAAQLTVKMEQSTVDELSFFNVNVQHFASAKGDEVGESFFLQHEHTSARAHERTSNEKQCMQEMGTLLQTIAQGQSLEHALRQKLEEFYACDEREDFAAMFALQKEVQQFAAALDPTSILPGRIYFRLGKCHEKLGYSTARQLYADAKVLAEQSSDKEGVGMCLIGLGNLYEAEFWHHKAIATFEQRLQLATRDGERVQALTQMGDCYFSLGDYTKSQELQDKCRQAAQRCEESGEKVEGASAAFLMARSGSCKARCLQATGELAQSIEIAEDARVRAETLGEIRLSGEIASQIGSCLTILGRHEEAMVYHLRYWAATRHAPLAAGEKITMQATAALRVGTGLVHWLRAGRKDYDERLTTDLIDFWSGIPVININIEPTRCIDTPHTLSFLPCPSPRGKHRAQGDCVSATGE